MLYRAIGVMSGSSLDGLDIAFVEFLYQGGSWSFEIMAADCKPYSPDWKAKLQGAIALNALDYQLLHAEYGHYLGQEINQFIDDNNLHYKVALVGSHGHTTFHVPPAMTAQLGDGAAIAAETGLPVVSDLRALDVALGGQGAPIVPIGEKLLLKDYDFYLNLGGIANLSFRREDAYMAFDVCPANRVLNMVIQKEGKEYDAGGEMASGGAVHQGLLQKLNGLAYYSMPFPKSLANSFGTDEVYPLVSSFQISTADALRTYVEHIVEQLKLAIVQQLENNPERPGLRLLATGGGALNSFLIRRLAEELQPYQVEVVVPDEKLVQYKEALIMAFMGVLRWRQEYNVFASVTGAQRDSIGGALWIGQDA
jgi:anhydro-N-acetylmuramic acid kinase